MGNTKSKNAGTAIAAVEMEAAAQHAKNTLIHHKSEHIMTNSSTQTSTPPGKAFVNQHNSPNSIHSNSPGENTNNVSHDVFSGNTPGTTVLIVQPETTIENNSHSTISSYPFGSPSSPSFSSSFPSPRGPLSVTSQTSQQTSGSLVSPARQAQMMEALIHEGALLTSSSPTKIPNYPHHSYPSSSESSSPTPSKFSSNQHNKSPHRNPLTPSTVRSNGGNSIDTTPSYQHPTISHTLRQRSISPGSSTLTFRSSNTNVISVSPNQKEDKERDAHTLPTWMTHPPSVRLTSTGLQSHPNSLALKEKEQREQQLAQQTATIAALQSIESLKGDLKAKEKVLQEATAKAVKLSIALDAHNESKANLLQAYELSKKETENLKNQLQTIHTTVQEKMDQQKMQQDALQVKINELMNALQLRDKEILEQRKLHRQYAGTIQQLQETEQKLRTENGNQGVMLQDMTIALESAHQARDSILNEYNEYRMNSSIAQTARTAAEETAAQLRVQVLTMKEKMNRMNQAKLLAERKAEALARYVKSHTEILSEDNMGTTGNGTVTMVTPTKGTKSTLTSSTGSTGRPTLLHSPVRSTMLLSPSNNLASTTSPLSPSTILAPSDGGMNGSLDMDTGTTNNSVNDLLVTDPDANLDDYAAIANGTDGGSSMSGNHSPSFYGSDDPVSQLKALLAHRGKRIEVLTTKLADAEANTIGLRAQVTELTNTLHSTKEKAMYYEKRAAYQSDLLKRLRAQGVTMASEGLDTLATSRFASKSPLGKLVGITSPNNKNSNSSSNGSSLGKKETEGTNSPISSSVPAVNTTDSTAVRTVPSSSSITSPTEVSSSTDTVLTGQVPIRSPTERMNNNQRTTSTVSSSPRGGHFTPRNSRPPSSSFESGIVIDMTSNGSHSATQYHPEESPVNSGSRIPSRTNTPGGSGIAAVRAMQQIVSSPSADTMGNGETLVHDAESSSKMEEKSMTGTDDRHGNVADNEMQEGISTHGMDATTGTNDSLDTTPQETTELTTELTTVVPVPTEEAITNEIPVEVTSEAAVKESPTEVNDSDRTSNEKSVTIEPPTAEDKDTDDAPVDVVVHSETATTAVTDETIPVTETMDENTSNNHGNENENQGVAEGEDRTPDVVEVATNATAESFSSSSSSTETEVNKE